MGKGLQTLDERNSVFNNIQMCSMVLSILTTPAFRLIKENFKNVVQEGPTYICDICWKFEFRRNAIKLKEPKYKTHIYIMDAHLVNQIGYVKVAIILCQKIKSQCRRK